MTYQKNKALVPQYRLRAFFDALCKFGRITPHQARVFIALSTFNGRQGCYPSHAILAAESGVSDRTVRNALKEARLRGWIEWTNERHGRRQSSNRYCFILTSEYVNKILSGLQKFKQKTAEISNFFRRHHMPGSPYSYIKKERSYVWEREITSTKDRLSEYQELLLRDKNAAIAMIKKIYEGNTH